MALPTPVTVAQIAVGTLILKLSISGEAYATWNAEHPGQPHNLVNNFYPVLKDFLRDKHWDDRGNNQFTTQKSLSEAYKDLAALANEYPRVRFPGLITEFTLLRTDALEVGLTWPVQL